jgi:hypothetical protein
MVVEALAVASTFVIPTEVEESLTISVVVSLFSTEISRDVSTPLDMTQKEQTPLQRAIV